MDIESKRFRITATGWGGYEAKDKRERPETWHALDPDAVRASGVLDPQKHEREFDRAMGALIERAKA